MKKSLIILCALAVQLTCGSHGAPPTPKPTPALDKIEAANIKTYDLLALKAHDRELVGKIVKLKFNHRGDQVRPDEDRTGIFHGEAKYFGSSRTTKNEPAFGYLNVVIPEAGVAWFRRITTNSNSTTPLIVFAKILKSESGQIEGELLGRELKTDFRASTFVW